jgi:hypothetical protein
MERTTRNMPEIIPALVFPQKEYHSPLGKKQHLNCNPRNTGVNRVEFFFGEWMLSAGWQLVLF